MRSLKKLSKNTLNILRDCDREIILKREQEIAVEDLLAGKDVLAFLPTTGFEKSLIFSLFVLAMQEMKKLTDENTSTCCLVIYPWESIIDDQIAEMLSLNCTAMGPCLV